MSAEIFMSHYDNEGYFNHGLREPTNLNVFQTTKEYRDLSTIIVTPTRKGNSISSRWMGCYLDLMKPMNQKVFGPMFIVGMEVGEAYNEAIKRILNHDILKNVTYLVTLEDDVLPPPDGLLKLYEDVQHYDVVGGLYYSKGDFGWPMIYGDVSQKEIGWAPQEPKSFKEGENTLQECYGLGMGFNIYKMDIFKKMEYPWFETLQHFDKDLGVQGMTQDLHAFQQMYKAGYRFACDVSLKCGHFDANGGDSGLGFTW
ncbi:MAG TPA: hypothetical protein VKR58_05810 [Aquella sp.]|nr:hypothetical protein [Aquella sp.]